MPTYEYLCEACDHRFELFQSITADPIRVCPQCKRRKVRRLIGPGAAILFKGSGFYQTDYRSEAYKKAAAAEKSGGSSDGNGETSSTGSSGKKERKSKVASEA